MTIMHYIKNFHQISIEHRMLIVTCATAFFLSIICIIINLLMGLGFSSIFPLLILLAASITAFYFYHYKHSNVIPAAILISVISIYTLPSMWLASGGLTGAMPYYYIINIGCTVVMLKGLKRRSLLFSLQMLILCGLILAEVSFPHVITRYPDVKSQDIDITIALFLLAVTLFILLHRLTAEYNRLLSIVERANKNLENINQDLREKSIKDPLTGIYNRRFIMDRLEIMKEHKDNFPISIIMFDIDHFKSVNDTYGHNFGDAVLVGISRKVNSKMRKTDYFGRYGGEEFLIILKNAPSGIAQIRADKMRQAVEALRWEHEELTVTISCGVYEINKHQPLKQALEKADMAMYEAKNNGRNQVICA